jgi:uncharacterized membrane protein YdbT with pleckstrin-like domain
MGYVEQNLMRDEMVCYKARLHWFIYFRAILLGVVALVLFALALKLSLTGRESFGLLPYAPGMLVLLSALTASTEALVRRSSTELAVTTKRVIVKTGFIRRNTIELNHSKVESFHVEQGVMGRIFGFGTLIIHGTGGGMTPIADIGDPLGFRKHAMEVIDLTS